MSKRQGDRTQVVQAGVRSPIHPKYKVTNIMIERRSVPELLKTPILDLPEGKKPIRLLACGVPLGVNNMVHHLHVLKFAQTGEWSPPLPSPVEGEIIRILTRYIIISG